MRLAATLGAPHQQIYDQRGSPQSSCVTPGEAPTMYHYVCMYHGLLLAGWLVPEHTTHSMTDKKTEVPQAVPRRNGAVI